MFTEVGKSCADCHADIHRRQFGANCAECHTVLGWQVSVQSIKQHFNRFPLLGAHAVVECQECHKNAAAGQYLGLSTACASCHMTDFQKTATIGGSVPNHVASAFFSSSCETCHSFGTWLNAKFDHSQTGFLLANGHANVACASCHINNNYNLTTAPTDCGNSGCHLTTWQQTSNPVHASAGAPFALANCTTCHTTASWTTATFDHSTTGFLLTNGHANVACASCHINNNYTLTIAPTDCGNSGCHLTTWQQTNNPAHATSGAQFAAGNCAVCHSTVSWTAASFNHNATGFALTGTHLSPAPTPCASCHIGNNYTLSSTDCYGCHQAAFLSTTSIGGSVPNHLTAGFPTTAPACATCHPITTWAAGVFDHSATGFLLTNGHANVVCNLCHISNNFSLTIAPTDCGNSGCHLTTWQQTNTPVHSTSGSAFAAANCSTCHATVSWTTATFDHGTTGFALTGTHFSPSPTPCVSCHIGNNYTLSSTDCYGCHQAAFLSTTTIGGAVPNHVTAGFPITAAQCASCHPISTWAAGVFDHTTTGFPLTNSHAAVACALCHIGGNYTLAIAPAACGTSGCHLTTWQQTNNPVHSSAGAAFAVGNCSTCHTTVSWSTATFDHSTTGFALTGLHISPLPTPCISCHVGNNYTLSSAARFGCHLTAWQSTATLGGVVPNHITAGFPTDCSICHSTINWTSSTFNHSTTGFALTGLHISPVPTSCVSCHVNGNYALNSAACYGCHIAAWQSTTTLGGAVPNHVASGYPQTCDSCHTTSSWLGATFNHNATGFPLTSAHIMVACNLCHITSAVPPTDCYSCHTAKWQSTATLGGSVPNHLAADAAVAGIVPTACSTCHSTTTNWLGATFTHSWFNLSHGNNAAGGVCANCHTNTLGASATYTAFQCTGCHGGNIAANFHHPSVGGYVYNSVNCYQFHKKG